MAVEEVKSGWPSRAFASAVVLARYLVVAALAVAAFAAWRYLPGISSLPETGVRGLLPSSTPAARAEAESARLFGASLLPRIAVVQRNPRGLPAPQQRRILALALRLDRDELHAFPRGSRALPYLNTGRLAPGSRERSTAAITFLGFPERLAPRLQRNYAYQYARAVSVPGAKAEATGFLPGSLAQTDAIDRGLRWVELATVLVVASIIGVYLRSVLAPVVTLLAAGIAYLTATGVVSYLAEQQGVRVQNEVEPIIVVLLLGVVTDYSVFFLAGMRGRLRAGEPPRVAARRATAQVVPIIVTAGLLVAAGLVTLRLASIGFVQQLGPAMAVVVLVSLGVAITFVPAAMGILGRVLFWPGLRPPRERDPLVTRAGATLRRLVASGTSRRWLAVPTALAVVAILALSSSGLAFTRLALTPIRALTSDTPPAHAAREAGLAFTPGVIAPTELVLRRPGIGAARKRVSRFERALAAQPEVGAVVGATTLPLPPRYGPVFRSRGNGAVRFYLAFRHHPYSSAAIDDLDRLQTAVPGLLRRAGLGGAHVLYAGDTALAKETTGRIHHDLLWVGLAAALVNVVLLAIFLRSLVAPLLLVGSSLLAITGTFGAATYFFRDALATPDLTYFVPLAVGVLLLSFGTDYNLFIVGRIWQEARDMTTAEAIRAAVPRAGRAISIAGIALALSFATLAIVPIAPFREFAVLVGLGVLVDTFLVRTVLIPALIAVLGSKAWWPGRRGVRRRAREAPAAAR